MADDSDLIFREVDDEMRAEKLRNFGARFGSWLFAACLLLIVSTLAYEFWIDRRHGAAESATGAMLSAQEAARLRQFSTAASRFASGAQQSPAAAPLARLQQAISLEQANDAAGAQAIYKDLAAHADNEAVRNYAALQADNFQPFSESRGAFAPFAAELQAAELLKTGKNKEAESILQNALSDQHLPETQRTRLTQLSQLARRSKSN